MKRFIELIQENQDKLLSSGNYRPISPKERMAIMKMITGVNETESNNKTDSYIEDNLDNLPTDIKSLGQDALGIYLTESSGTFFEFLDNAVVEN